MRRLFILLLLSQFSTVSLAAGSTVSFVTAKLAHGAVVGIPASWDVAHGDELQAMLTCLAAADEASGNAESTEAAETLLSASSPGPEHHAAVSITTSSAPNITPDTPSLLDASQMEALQARIRQTAEAEHTGPGARIRGWSLLEKAIVGRNTVLHTSYVRSSEAGEHRVHVYKFFGHGRLFNVTLSTNAKDESINGFLLEKIVRSFVVP